VFGGQVSVDGETVVDHGQFVDFTQAEQLELITDDPRVKETVRGVVQEWKAFRATSKEVGGLITRSQAAKILDSTTDVICTWIRRGRLTGYNFLGTHFCSSKEVLLLAKERLEGNISKGGRGKKAPSLAEMVKAAKSDYSEAL